MRKQRNTHGVARKLVVATLICVVPTAWAVGVQVPTPAATVAKVKPVRVITAPPGFTLEQAVAKVQKQTQGKVLRAGTRQYGQSTEYRIKVLMPDGHVRVIPVRTKPTDDSSPPKPEETH